MLIVVRHGRTEANASGLLLGRLDVDLDDVGRAQAAALATAVGPVDRILSSPLARTRATAAAWGAAFGGHPVEVDERLIELDYGAFDGCPITDVPVETWDQWRGDLDFTPPGGESLAAMGRRVRSCCDELADAGRDGKVVLVTHVSPIKAIVAWALGVGDEVAWRMFVAPASITTIGWGRAGPSLHSFNDTRHLDGA